MKLLKINDHLSVDVTKIVLVGRNDLTNEVYLQLIDKSVIRADKEFDEIIREIELLNDSTGHS